MDLDSLGVRLLSWLAAGVVLTFASHLALKGLQRAAVRGGSEPGRVRLGSRVLRAWILLLWVSLVRSFWSTEPLRDAPDWIGTALTSAIILAAGYFVGRVLFVVFQVLHQQYDLEGPDNLHSRQRLTQLQFVEKIGYVVVGFFTLCLALLVFDDARRIGTSLLASAGVASVIVAFAGQKSLANLIAGMQIAFTQPLRIEDAVVVEGEWGWVEEINLTYVVIRLWDQRRLVLPITYFVEKPFQNWTRTSAQILGAVTLQLSPRVPVAELEAELLRLLKGTELWDGDRWVLQVTEAGERTITLRALMTARDSPTCWDLRCLVRRGLIEYLQAHHPESFATVDVRLPAGKTDQVIGGG